MTNENKRKEEDENEEMAHLADKYSFCRVCGEEMFHTPLVICADCLGEECDKFVEEVEKTNVKKGDKKVR